MAKYPQSLRALRLVGCRNDEEHTLCFVRQSASVRGGTINDALFVPHAQMRQVLMTITTSEFEAALPSSCSSLCGLTACADVDAWMQHGQHAPEPH